MQTKYLGLLTFDEGLIEQEKAYAQVSSSLEPLLLGLEHSNSVTIGKRGEEDGDFPGLEDLKARAYDFHLIDRGGQATLHQPGQLVIYPFIPLREYQWGARMYVEYLEDCVQKFLQTMGILSHLKPGSPGIYTEKGKIAFLGIRIDRGISRHGLSINIKNQIEDFQYIKACGTSNLEMDRVSNYAEISLPQAFEKFCEIFQKNLK